MHWAIILKITLNLYLYVETITTQCKYNSLPVRLTLTMLRVHLMKMSPETVTAAERMSTYWAVHNLEAGGVNCVYMSTQVAVHRE